MGQGAASAEGTAQIGVVRAHVFFVKSCVASNQSLGCADTLTSSPYVRFTVFDSHNRVHRLHGCVGKIGCPVFALDDVVGIGKALFQIADLIADERLFVGNAERCLIISFDICGTHRCELWHLPLHFKCLQTLFCCPVLLRNHGNTAADFHNVAYARNRQGICCVVRLDCAASNRAAFNDSVMQIRNINIDTEFGGSSRFFESVYTAKVITDVLKCMVLF